MTPLGAIGGYTLRTIVLCDRCPAIGLAAPGQAPAGWVVSGDTRVCGDCHRRIVRK
jgi:hypothetical protein